MAEIVEESRVPGSRREHVLWFHIVLLMALFDHDCGSLEKDQIWVVSMYMRILTDEWRRRDLGPTI